GFWRWLPNRVSDRGFQFVYFSLAPGPELQESAVEHGAGNESCYGIRCGHREPPSTIILAPGCGCKSELCRVRNSVPCRVLNRTSGVIAHPLSDVRGSESAPYGAARVSKRLWRKQ